MKNAFITNSVYHGIENWSLKLTWNFSLGIWSFSHVVAHVLDCLLSCTSMVTNFTPLPPGLSPDTPHPSKLMYVGLASFGIISAIVVSYLYFLTPPKGAVPLALRKPPAMTKVASVVPTTIPLPSVASPIATLSAPLVASPVALLSPPSSASASLASPAAQLASPSASITIAPTP